MIDNTKRIILNYIGIAFGSFFTAAGLVMFLVPNKIASGGVSGIATVLHYLFGFRVGLVILVINIPLFIIAIRVLGKRVGARTLWGILSLSGATELLMQLSPVLTTNTLLATIYGGALAGIGIGLVFKSEGTTGGTDLVAALLNHYLPGFSMGQGLLLIDAMVIMMAGIVFNAELALYAIIAIFVQSRVIDFIQEGFNYTKSVLIVSNNSGEISQKITKHMERGVTALKGYGVYSGENKHVLMVTISRSEISRLKKLIFEVDNNAFVVFTNAHEVLGEGFKEFRSSSFN